MMNPHRSSNGQTGRAVHPQSSASRQGIIDTPSEEQDFERTILSGEIWNERARKGEDAPIERLPPEILEEIFHCYRQDAVALSRGRLWEWHRLVHVCQKWRSIIFASANRLGLRLFCTNGTPVRSTLHCWPDLPIVMQYGPGVCPGPNPLAAGNEDEILTVLQKPGRILMIHLTLTEQLLDKLAGMTPEPFPAMEVLELTTQTDVGLALPDQFLGGKVPRLHTLRTVKTAFPALPQLLLSAKNLVSLQLEAIPSKGYISPDVLITSLSEMDSLQMFHIHFLSPKSDPVPSLEDTPHYPLKRTSLPSLKHFEFHGTYEYLEYLLAHIRAPVKYIYITFFGAIDFSDLPQLQWFIADLTEKQRFPNEATVCYSRTNISITFARLGTPLRLGLRILCKRFDWQMKSLADICAQLLPPGTFSAVRQLDFYASPPFPDGHGNINPALFLYLFRAFGGVKILRVTNEVVPHVVEALRADVELPTARELYFEDNEDFVSTQIILSPFLKARRRLGLPVALHPWQPSNDLRPSAHYPSTRPTRTPTPFTHRNDPALMLEEDIRKISERFSHHPFAVQSLYQRAQFLLQSFVQGREVQKLDNSIEIARDLLDMRPRQIRRVELFQMLAFCFALGGHDPNHREKSVSMFGDAFQDESATTSEKLKIAWWWAIFARAWDHSSATMAYQNTLSALHSSLTGTFTPQRRPATVGCLGSKIQIPLEYASYRIEKGQLELAVETIEQGKTLIWSEIYGLRPFVGRLCRVNADLADRLAAVNKELVAVNASILACRVDGSQLDEGEDHEHMDDFSPLFKKRRRLLRERQDVTVEIKALPGFENFMEPLPFRTLQHAASRGPIIIINHCPWRCDVLIVLHDSPPSLIPMTDGFYERANTLASGLLDSRKYGVESELYQQELRSVLKELNERIGRPVINRLRELGIPEQSRIWWYPTSLFCSLPLHAMGPVLSIDGHDQYFSDLYVCSYTPTLSALIAAREFAVTSGVRHSLLSVCGPTETSLRTKNAELTLYIGRVPAVNILLGKATREVVFDGLQPHRIAHFECGSLRGEGKPFDTALELHEGDRITLFDIVCSQVPTAELAVLSAGRTAELVDGTEFVEGLHLTSAMQYHGFRGVVGAMWDLGDDGAEDLSLDFYSQMFSRDAADNTSFAERSAMALQHTVQKLRENGASIQRWVNWVHYGV